MIDYTEQQYAIYMECVNKLVDNGLFPLVVISKQDIEDRYNVKLTDKEFNEIYVGTTLQMDDFEEQGLEFILNEVESVVFPQLIKY